MHELTKLSATEVVELLRKGEVTPLELVEISAARIEQVEPSLNALPTLCIEQAIAAAKMMMESDHPIDPNSRGWLGGLPISVKDLVETKGIKTTFGSPIYADYIPSKSDVLVEKIEKCGGIVVGKSNTPEFGAGASTFNQVFGRTYNPWKLSKSVAGSSGGACASVASGEVWLGTGSDLGGSLRTPASFNSVVGLRPSPGRVPRSASQPFDTLHVQGPIARNVPDLALFLDAMSGFNPQDPLSYCSPNVPYAQAVKSPPSLKRVAFSSDLGIAVVDPEVERICSVAVMKFEDAGVQVGDGDCPSFAGAIDCFNVLRAASFACDLGPDLRKHREKLKPDVVWNVEQGLKLTADDIGKAERTRKRILNSVVKFFEKFDLLICPCAIVPPFDVETRYVEEVQGHKFESYFEWLSITFAITLTGCPVLALPAGFTLDGLPIGVQLVGPPRGESNLLAAGALFEELTGISKQLPIDPR